jgi:O-acetyl-ADP-ribose deacetylase (regulator of RNase III)
MIEYREGDATQPVGPGLKIISHIVNDENKWGAGFVLALSKRWKQPELYYRSWLNNQDCWEIKPELGNIQIVPVEKDIVVANMIAQHGVYWYWYRGTPPIRYDALEKCLTKLDKYAKDNEASVHMPKIGAGLGGGDWYVIEKIINKTLLDIDVTVYLLNPIVLCCK